MNDAFDKHKFANQPAYYTKAEKILAREQVVKAYRDCTGLTIIPEDKGYWTLCNWQPDDENSEINQLVNLGLLQKKQFFGIDNDRKNEGIIEANKNIHPEANWFKGEWLEVIEANYELFNPALVYFDYTRTILTTSCHMYLGKTMNMCHKGVVVAANLMVSDGHSSKRFDPNFLLERLAYHLRHPNEWMVFDNYYPYKASQTDMATYIFRRVN